MNLDKLFFIFWKFNNRFVTIVSTLNTNILISLYQQKRSWKVSIYSGQCLTVLKCPKGLLEIINKILTALQDESLSSKVYIKNAPCARRMPWFSPRETCITGLDSSTVSGQSCWVPPPEGQTWRRPLSGGWRPLSSAGLPAQKQQTLAFNWAQAQIRANDY